MVGGLSSDEKDVLDKLSYDEKTDTVIADASLQVKPSTVYLGSSFGMSNAVQAVGFRLADGTDALCMVNRFNQDEGSISNPKFFAIGQSSMLNINLVDSTVMSDPVEVGYTTVDDNLTYSFEIKPAGAGRLQVQYWFGNSDTGAPVVDFHRDITQAEVDSNQPVLVEPNFYILAGNSPVFARFSGVPLKGDGILPWFRSKILPYKEITINGHVEFVSSDVDPMYIGCTYGVVFPSPQGPQNLTFKPKMEFKDTFSIVYVERAFSNNSKVTIDFSKFNQDNVEITQQGANLTFAYSDGDGWYIIDNNNGHYNGRV